MGQPTRFEPEPMTPTAVSSESSAVRSRLDATRLGSLLTVKHVLWGLSLLLLSLVAADQIRRAAPFRVDDAYITFSFSKNVGTGHGPVFSHGLRVEGYSNFLWMLVVAIRYVFVPDGDPYPFARAVAYGCLAFACFAAYKLARRMAGPVAGLGALGLLVCCSDLFRAAASGLETAAFCAAIIGGWLSYLAEEPSRRRWSLVGFVIAALLRIDGFVPLLIVCGVEFLSSLAERGFSFAKFLRWSAPAFGVWAAYFAWRYNYYGLPLPTTYYAKSVVSLNDPDRGVRQAWDFLRDSGALPLIPLMTVPLLRGARRAAFGLSVAILLQVFHAANVGGDWMPFNRFFLPVVPLAAVLAGAGTAELWRFVARSTIVSRWGTRAVLLASLAFTGVHLHSASVDTPQETDKLGNAAHVGKHTRESLLVATDLMAYVVRRPGDRLVTDYAGVFSVFTDAEVIDMWGLCNVDIALHGGTNGINPIYGKECAECYARLKPDYFHVNVPIIRTEDSLHDLAGVLDNVFQGYAIDRVIHIRKNFGVGRVVEESTGRTLWFLERRRAELPLETHRPAPGIRVDYPFE